MFNRLYWYWLTIKVIDEYGEDQIETIYLIMPKHPSLKEIYKELRQREIEKDYKPNSTAILFMQRGESC